MYGRAYASSTEAGEKWNGPPRPELKEGLSVWYEDFWELSTDRQIGMAAGPIPRASIVDHCRGWPDDDAEMFRICMRRMDDIYINHKPSKQPFNNKLAELSPQDRLTAIFGDKIK